MRRSPNPQSSTKKASDRSRSSEIEHHVRNWSTAAWFCGIVALAFVIRWAFIAQAQTVVFFRHPVVDARAYWEWAGRIAGGDWLGSGVFYQAPLYPYFLALVRRFITEDAVGVRLVQAALGAIGCGLLFLAGCRFYSRTAGLIAGGLLALFAPAVFFDGLIQKAVLDALLMSALLLALAGVVARPSAGRVSASGLLLGLLALTRENALLLIPVLPAWLIIRMRGGSPRSITTLVISFCAGLALPIGPVMVRNAVKGGEWALTTSQAGANFYIGNNPTASGTYAPLRAGRSDTPLEREDATRLAEAAIGRALTPREVSHYWLNRAWTFIRGEPGRWTALLLRKSLLLINSYELPDAEDIYFHAESSTLLRTLLMVGHYGLLVPLAVAGMALSWRRIAGIRVVHLLVVTLSPAIIAFFVFARYRHVLAPPLMLFAAVGIVETVRAFRAGECRSLAFAAALASLSAIPANWPLFNQQALRATSYVNAGATLSRAGELPAAIDYYRRALQLNPTDAGAYANLGLALGRMGRLEEAILALRESDRLQPGDPDTLRKLGIAHGERGDWRKAAEYLALAVSADPTSVQSVSNWATALIQSGTRHEAIEALRAGVKAQAGRSPLSAMLAWQLSTCPDDGLRNGVEAIELVESACRPGADPTLDELEALAAAYAESGRFEDAAAIQKRAIDSAGGARNVDQAGLHARLRTYQAGKAWREPR